jgi:hypothetical protein
MNIRSLPALLVLCAVAAPGFGQIIPKNAADPLKVSQLKGDFAKKLDGAVMPTGKGWKAVTDSKKRLQLMVPDNWKVVPDPEQEAVLRLVPPGNEKEVKAALSVALAAPRDSDPLEVDEMLASSFADDLATIPEYRRSQYAPTDSGFVTGRGMKFALAGGTMVDRSKTKVRQVQLLYIGEDRIVKIQFATLESEWPKYAADVAKVFASYETLGMIKNGD